MASEKTILEILNWLDTNSDHDLIKERIPLYIQVLADLPGPILKQAALAHVSKSRFFPHPSELRSEAFDILAEIDPIPSQYDAWSEVQSAIRRVTHLGEPEFSHALIGKVVDVFGWEYLCLSTNTMADRAHFFKSYAALVEKHRSANRWPAQVKTFIAEEASQVKMLSNKEGMK
ncbi:MAG: hypothetical protein U9Q82_11140 [Chloroflexota bacterium]|nr:hypothetical protein [Chloroflexota bacterium]